MMSTLRKWLFFLAKTNMASLFIGYSFQYLSVIIPVKKVSENNLCMLFYHPHPYWKLHVLAVPKQRIRSFMHLNLDAQKDIAIVLSIFREIKDYAFANDINNYIILVNGGNYQEVQQLHFHLGVGRSKGNNQFGKEIIPTDSTEVVVALGNTQACAHTEPLRQVHYVVVNSDTLKFDKLDLSSETTCKHFIELLKVAQMAITKLNLHSYSVMFNISDKIPDSSLALHIYSGGWKE